MAKHSENQHVRTRAFPSIAYVAIVMVLFACPFVLMGLFPAHEEQQNQELAPWPSVTVDGHLNNRLLSEMGDYFEDHFAFRDQMISIDSALYDKLFGVSITDQVVIGSDGWLYYSETMDDYRRSVVITEHAAQNAAYNLSLVQKYVERKGADFLLTIAPNKNSLYPEQMPLYQRAGEGDKSIDVLKPQLEAYQVDYVDLFDAFSDDPRTLYMKTDSHWTNEGALLAYNVLLDAANTQHDDYTGYAPTTQTDFIGDLQVMLYPLSRTAEEQPLYRESLQFEYANGSTGVTDGDIVTRSTRSNAQGSFLMYRDSFGNALLPYLATHYQQAHFTKLVPYDLTQIIDDKPQTVVIERAERHLGSFATDAPIMSAPVISVSQPTETIEGSSTLSVEEDGTYYRFDGTVDPALAVGNYKIALGIMREDGSVDYLQAFRISDVSDGGNVSMGNDFGYTVRVLKTAFPQPRQHVCLVVIDDSEVARIVLDDTIALPH